MPSMDPLWWTLAGQALTKNAVQRHLVRAGLWRASAHKLRHTFGTRLVEAGVDLLVIKDLLGHATVATTQIYALCGEAAAAGGNGEDSMIP